MSAFIKFMHTNTFEFVLHRYFLEYIFAVQVTMK